MAPENNACGLCRSERLWARAPDGVEVPISLVYRKDLVRVGGAGSPLLLEGYGAYGIAVDPFFDTARLSLLDRCGVSVSMESSLSCIRPPFRHRPPIAAGQVRSCNAPRLSLQDRYGLCESCREGGSSRLVRRGSTRQSLLLRVVAG